jgi:hypothetical protein
MRRSLTRIRTSHVGRLPPPKGWADMPARLAGAEITDPVVIACGQSGACQGSGTVNLPLRPSFAGAGRNLPLPKPVKHTILGSKSQGSGECRVKGISHRAGRSVTSPSEPQKCAGSATRHDVR